MKIQASNSIRRVLVWVLVLSGTLAGMPGPLPAGITPAPNRFVLVLDPGHGGEDRGIKLSDALIEKNITARLAAKIKERMISLSNLEVDLTRATDVSLTVLDRTSLANRKSANLFISLHLGDSDVQGEGTVFLWTNQFVNEPAAIKRDHSAPNNGIKALPWETAQNTVLEPSRQFCQVLKKAWEKSRKKYSQIKNIESSSAPIGVLTGAECPAMLAEIIYPMARADQNDYAEELLNETADLLAGGIQTMIKIRRMHE